MKHRNKQHGFTLIELLIVVAIVAILAAIAIPNFLKAHIKAKTARARADMRNLATALTSYEVDYGEFPYYYLYRWEYGAGAQPPLDEYGTLEENIWELSILTTPLVYITGIPFDPFGHAGIEQPVPYDYSSFEAFKVANFQMGDSERNAKWVLKCRGPDLIFASMVDYDPTNGVVSPGDIKRYGNWTTEQTP